MTAVSHHCARVSPVAWERLGDRYVARLLDQTLLPHQTRWLTIETPEAMADAITRMIVRGAPAIGIAAAYGLALGAQRARGATASVEAMTRALSDDAAHLLAARPTAVNLHWALARLRAVWERPDSQALSSRDALQEALIREAQAIHEDDRIACDAIGAHGATLIPQGARIITHCNAGALATGGRGTALGVIRSAFERDSAITVLADETRPRLQGGKLTAWELRQDGIPVHVIPDGAAASLMRAGRVDVAIVGADRIAANGDTANKIGTYALALAARAHNIPFYVAAPLSTFDFSAQSGAEIPIEERDAREVTHHEHTALFAADTPVLNPAFDVTPGNFIAAFITECGIIRPPYDESLAQLATSAF
ncbi:MAG: S-methyl-5-thioribose-1-phosphate isomerase [Vampirovibrionales bacterium]|nr:S-methyl-5-thioribose-1-phosphate isomerase [Vampirovibrionales bacterium]